MASSAEKIEGLTVAVITRNEEKNLRRCLESVPFAGEIVVVDSGSTDGTVQVAEEFGARVLDQPFLGFGRQKNFAVDQARGQWVLVLDADEWLDPACAAEVRDKVHPHTAADAFWMLRRTRFLGRWMVHSWSNDYTLRLFRRGKARFEDKPIHEKLVLQPGTRVGRIKAPYFHDTYEDLHHYIEKMNRYSSLFARDPATDPRFSWPRMLASPLTGFLKTYVLKLGFLDGPQGFVLAVGTAYYHFLKYAKKWEKLRGGSSQTSLVSASIRVEE